MRGRDWHVTSFKGAVAAGLAAGALTFAAAPAGAQPNSTNVDENPIWAGYAVSGAAGTFSNVAASWTVPAVTCSPGETSYSSDWVGLDGFNSRTVEQIGTDSDCINGAPTYYAWYEIYPKRTTLISTIQVSAHLPISASVHYAPPAAHGQGTFTVSLNNFSTSAKSPSAHRSSAEVITEAPSSNHGPFGALPLSNFGSVTFTGASANNTAFGDPSFASSLTELEIVQGNTVEASPNNSLTPGGNKFTVSWQAS